MFMYMYIYFRNESNFVSMYRYDSTMKFRNFTLKVATNLTALFDIFSTLNENN